MDVRIEGLRFERGGRLVLDIPSLLLREGRTTVVLGPNGAGKSTLLRLIAALERPVAGRIAFGGVPVRPDFESRRSIAYVFQEDVFLSQTVRANLELGLKLRGVDAATRRERIERAAALLEIAALLDRRPDRLSGGERRRASLARALCMDAPLMLLDEPLAGLDARTYTRLLDTLPDTLRAARTTAALVTHDADEAVRLGDDLVVLLDGRVHAAGEKWDVVRNPRSARVAEILGYVVLAVEGRRVAVRPGDLTPGPGLFQFSVIVEGTVATFGDREVIGRIADTRVRIPLRGGVEPMAGDVMVVHAARACEVR